MPGIFGFVSEHPVADPAGLARAMGSLLSTHPGQRAAAVCGARWALGATWSPGLQLEPEPARHGDAWLVACGERYPAGEAVTAAPVAPGPAVLEALRARAPARLAGLNGQFAAAVLDPALGEVQLACDRHGLHALAWVQRDGLFAFASEPKALLAVPGGGPTIDPEGAAALLLLGEHFSDTTMLRGVRVAPAASHLRSAGGPPAITNWWRVQYPGSVRRLPPDEVAAEVGRRLRRAVARQVAGPGRIVVPLSGGLDSRLCLAGVPAARRPDVTAFTWGDPGCLDRRYAPAIARACEVRHRDYDYRYQALVEGAAGGAWITDGLAGATDFHILSYVPDLAAEGEVVLNGFAGDVLLGGNFHWRRVRALPRERLARAVFAKRNDALPLAEAAAALRGEVREAAAGLEASYQAAFEAHRQEDPLGQLDAFLLDSRIRRWTSFGTQLLRTRLVSRAPFYDLDVFDLVAEVPPDWRTEHRFYRRVLLLAFPEVARVGWQTTGFPASWPSGLCRPAGAALRRGRSALERLSRGALPSPYPVARLARAFRGPLAARLEAALFRGTDLHWGIFDRAAGERIWRELLAGADGRAKLVGILLSLRFHLEQVALARPRAPLLPGE
ncbi:MAG: asparagine synthase-related protein, partial [Anaeromyxobacteraceae bacterium]|nr:asparagine synthase-related protein [Anaeromyxobacteraceae bacterium]